MFGKSIPVVLILVLLILSIQPVLAKDSKGFDIEKYLTPMNIENCNKGTTPITIEKIQVKSGYNLENGKNCEFPNPQNTSIAAKTLINLLKEYNVYSFAHDPNFNKGGDEMMDPSNWSVYSRTYISLNNENILSGLIIGNSYTGGAHLLHENISFIINSNNGAKLTIKDLVNKSSYANLMSLAYKSYLKYNVIDNELVSMEEAENMKEELFTYDKWNRNSMMIFDNIFLSKDYLIVHVPAYVYGSYADGDCYIPISINSMNDILTPLAAQLLLSR